uniref:Uncharacterized protein n=1 Tax=Anguilla anguilla TaxID=7936 RepID=A0A0E9RGK1_ANGAN
MITSAKWLGVYSCSLAPPNLGSLLSLESFQFVLLALSCCT